jgi:hypothetical protein
MRTVDSDRVGVLGIPGSMSRIRRTLRHWEESLGPRKIPHVGDVLDSLPRIGTEEASPLKVV